MISRLVRSADFERVLRTRSRVSSTHFAVYHLIDRPSAFVQPLSRLAAGELSTAGQPVRGGPVDDLGLDGIRSTALATSTAPDGRWLGLVVPKRHARRAVTRTLLKRQIRTAMTRHEAALAHGLWVVRLRAPFDRQQFVSAASGALKQTARIELDQLLSRAARPAAAS